MRNECPWNWRISASVQTGLSSGMFAAIELPIPEVFHLRRWTNSITVGDDSQRVYGRYQVEMLWNNLSQRTYFQLGQFIENSQQGTGLLFMTVDAHEIYHSGTHFMDISGYPYYPSEVAQAATLPGRKGPASNENVQIFLNAVTIVNDPSLYTIL